MSDNERFNGSCDTRHPCRRLILDSYLYSPGGLVTMLERVVTRSRMLDPIQFVSDDIIDSIIRSVTSCGESPVSEDLDQSANH